MLENLEDLLDDDEASKAFWDSVVTTTIENTGRGAEMMRQTTGATVKFDELALLCHNPRDEFMLIESAVRSGGWSMTAAAFDSVGTSPLPSRYGVHYSFMTRDDLPFRLEIMRLLSGHSPLHHIVAQTGRVVPVHLSFKCASQDEMFELTEQMRSHDWGLVQHCESTYGVFSYYTQPQDFPDVGVYFKPRVNTRDAANAGSAGPQA